MVTIIAMAMPSLPESIGYGSIIHFLLCVVAILHILRKPNDAPSLLWIFSTSFPSSARLPCAFRHQHHSGERLGEATLRQRLPKSAKQPCDPIAYHDATRQSRSAHSRQLPRTSSSTVSWIKSRQPPLFGGNAITLLERMKPPWNHVLPSAKRAIASA